MRPTQVRGYAVLETFVGSILVRGGRFNWAETVTRMSAAVMVGDDDGRRRS